METKNSIVNLSLIVDKAKLRRLIEKRNAEIGLVYVANGTAAESRRLALQDGVRPEDNLFSCGILASREEE